MDLSSVYNENYVIKKYGHIVNKKLKDISTVDLNNLIHKLSHDKMLIKTMKEVIKSREILCVENELKKLHIKSNSTKDDTKKELFYIDPEMKLTSEMIDIASLYSIDSLAANQLFENFHKYYSIKQFKSRDWIGLWNDWASKNVGFIYSKEGVFKEPNALDFTAPINGEKYPYIFINSKDFFQAEAVSNKIKNILEFDLKINWLDHYWDNIPINGIKWQECKHPFRGGDQTILYFDEESLAFNNFKDKIDSQSNQSNIISIDVDTVAFDTEKIKNDNLKKILEEQGVNWYSNYVNDNPISTKHGYSLGFKKVINPHTNQEEIFFKKLL